LFKIGEQVVWDNQDGSLAPWDVREEEYRKYVGKTYRVIALMAHPEDTERRYYVGIDAKMDTIHGKTTTTLVFDTNLQQSKTVEETSEQIVLTLTKADPVGEGRSGVWYVKLGVTVIGKVRRTEADDFPFASTPAVGEWAWWSTDRRALDDPDRTETGDFIGYGSKLLAAIGLLEHVIETRQEPSK